MWKELNRKATELSRTEFIQKIFLAHLHFPDTDDSDSDFDPDEYESSDSDTDDDFRVAGFRGSPHLTENKNKMNQIEILMRL